MAASSLGVNDRACSEYCSRWDDSSESEVKAQFSSCARKTERGNEDEADTRGGVAVLLETPPPVLGGQRLVVAECVLRRRHLAQNTRLRRRNIVHRARLPHAHKQFN
jgi:hypothetical protein